MKRCHVTCVSAGMAAISLLLSGCGGSGPAPSPSPSPAPSPSPGPAPSPTPAPAPAGTLRAICYGPMPSKKETPQRLPADVVQAGYEMQWGTKGRDDLANIKAMGANTVRLYHSLGFETNHDHGKFLDHAGEVGLKVMPGMHSDAEDFRLDPKKCGTDWNCYSYVKGVFLKGLQKEGFARGGKWHPAISTVILMNEPDFLDEQICGKERWCSNKLILSAFDGVLAAEKEAGIQGNIGLTVCMSLASRTSIDGKVTGPGIFGFQDLDAITQNPSLAHYEPQASQSDIRAAFMSRWEHCVNVPTPWFVTRDAYNTAYSQGFTFGNRPWFLGETAFDKMSDQAIADDLKSMDDAANAKDSLFRGVGIFQYQTAYWKDGDFEKQFGMFGLGDTVIGQTDNVCSDGGFYWYRQPGCWKYDVHCVTIPQSGQYGAGRAAVFAKAWGGDLNKVKTCGKNSYDVQV